MVLRFIQGFGIELNDLARHSGAALSSCWRQFRRFDDLFFLVKITLSADLMN